MELPFPPLDGSIPTPVFVSWLLMMLFLGAVDYGAICRFSPTVTQPATDPTRSSIGLQHGYGLPNRSTVRLLLTRRSQIPPSGDLEFAVDRPWSPGARLGIWFQPPRRVITGRKAHIRWWHRLRSLVLLAVFVVVAGVAVATAIGLMVFLSGFLLEQAIG